MSFCVASYFTCSLRASSASATSASSPIEAAPLSCRCVSLLFTQFHGKPNPNPRPHQSPSPYGAALTAVDRWSLSNDSRRHNSSSVPHPAWPRLHEIIRPHTARSPRFRAFRRRVSPLRPDILFLFPPRLTSAIDSSLHRSTGSFCTGLDDSRELRHPLLVSFNLHRSRVRRAIGFLLTAFSNATPYTFFHP